MVVDTVFPLRVACGAATLAFISSVLYGNRVFHRSYANGRRGGIRRLTDSSAAFHRFARMNGWPFVTTASSGVALRGEQLHATCFLENGNLSAVISAQAQADHKVPHGMKGALRWLRRDLLALQFES